MVAIALDVDGVLRDLIQDFVKKFNNYFDTNKSVSDLKDHDTIVDWCGSYVNLLEYLADWNCYRDARPYKNAVPFVYSLIEQYRDVSYVTSQPTLHSRLYTTEWLSRNDFPILDTHFCSKKTQVSFDLIVEDNPKEANDAIDKGRFAVLVSRPWNEEYVGTALVANSFKDTLVHVDRCVTLLNSN